MKKIGLRDFFYGAARNLENGAAGRFGPNLSVTAVGATSRLGYKVKHSRSTGSEEEQNAKEEAASESYS